MVDEEGLEKNRGREEIEWNGKQEIKWDMCGWYTDMDKGGGVVIVYDDIHDFIDGVKHGSHWPRVLIM